MNSLIALMLFWMIIMINNPPDTTRVREVKQVYQNKRVWTEVDSLAVNYDYLTSRIDSLRKLESKK